MPFRGPKNSQRLRKRLTGLIRPRQAIFRSGLSIVRKAERPFPQCRREAESSDLNLDSLHKPSGDPIHSSLRLADGNASSADPIRLVCVPSVRKSYYRVHWPAGLTTDAIDNGSQISREPSQFRRSRLEHSDNSKRVAIQD